MKKVFILATLLVLAITVLVVTNTYALFETNATADPELKVGKWVIKLNNRDISLDKIITLDDFDYVNTSHVEDGYFAPTSKAEFEIDVDASETDVSVEYDLSIDNSDILEYPNIGFKIIDLSTNQEINDINVSGIMYLNDTNKTKSYKIVLEWTNDPDYDESDTSLIGSELSFKLNIHFKQYIGE